MSSMSTITTFGAPSTARTGRMGRVVVSTSNGRRVRSGSSASGQGSSGAGALVGHCGGGRSKRQSASGGSAAAGRGRRRRRHGCCTCVPQKILERLRERSSTMLWQSSWAQTPSRDISSARMTSTHRHGGLSGDPLGQRPLGVHDVQVPVQVVVPHELAVWRAARSSRSLTIATAVVALGGEQLGAGAGAGGARRPARPRRGRGGRCSRTESRSRSRSASEVSVSGGSAEFTSETAACSDSSVSRAKVTLTPYEGPRRSRRLTRRPAPAARRSPPRRRWRSRPAPRTCPR